MENKKVISRDNLPTKLPFSTSLIAFILLDRFDAHISVWIAVTIFFVFIWLSSILRLEKQITVNLFKPKTPEEVEKDIEEALKHGEEAGSKFRKRLKELQKEKEDNER